MEKEMTIPNPETRLNVIKRYLHVLALLQKKDEEKDDDTDINKDAYRDYLWNASSLAEIISLDESPGKYLKSKNIRDYIKKHLKKEIGLKFKTKKGGRKTELEETLSGELLERIAVLYSSFVVKDLDRDMVLKTFLKKHPEDGLWLLARIYFAAIGKKPVSFNYTPQASLNEQNYMVCPYYLVFKNNNLYLYGRSIGSNKDRLFIVNRIKDFKIPQQNFDFGNIPPVEEIFKDTLSSFIGKSFSVKIRFSREISPAIEQLLDILDPEINEIGNNGQFEASFSTSDDLYLCMRLFMFGDRVEILEPESLRKKMADMLNESLKVYSAE